MNTRFLRLFSTLFILVPILLFLTNWFNPLFASIFVCGHIAFFVFYAKDSRIENETIISYQSLFAIAAIALIWTFLTGVGGFFLQTTDHVGHNSKFYDLYMHQWPILFPEKGTFSCYYYGYYLIPALFFKLVGGISVSFIVCYTFLGIWLGLIWLYLLLFRNILILSVFILCGGILFSSELISLALFRFSFSYNPVWSLFFQSIYVPNQIISVLIAAGIFLYYIRDYRWSFYLITLTFYWGVFPAAVLTLIFGINFIIDLFLNKKLPRLQTLTINYVLPVILFLPTFLFLTSSNQTPINHFYKFNTIASLVPFLEVILLILIVISLTKKKSSDKKILPLPIVMTALFMLLLLLTFRMGNFNDLFYRGSIPLFLIILLYVFQTLVIHIKENYQLFRTGKKGTLYFLTSRLFLNRQAIIILWIGLGCTASLYQIGQMARYNIFFKTYHPVSYNRFTNSYQALLKMNGTRDASQYLGNPKSLYFKYLAANNSISDQ